MGAVFINPLDGVDEDGLFKMLGDAWCAEIGIQKSYLLAVSIEIGKREFELVVPMLREALRQPYYQGTIARVESTLQVEATWKMPANVVLALTRQRGMIKRTLRPN